MRLFLLLLLASAAASTAEDLLEDDVSMMDQEVLLIDTEDFEDDLHDQESLRTDCYTDRKCRRKKGTCMESSKYCNGRVEKGCGVNCTCCVMEPERCKAESTCIKAKGYCMKITEKCPGWTFDGCKGHDCTCCVSENNCPNGFHHVGTECFKVIEHLTMWDKARQMCADHGWQLAEPEDLNALTSFIYNDIGVQYYFWIGGRGTGKSFTYISGQSVQEEPKWGQHGGASIGDCLTVGSTSSLYNNYTLSSFDCNDKYYFICEPGCPGGFFRTGSSCYKVTPRDLSWDDAEVNCYEQGLTLAEPEDPKRFATVLYTGVAGARYTDGYWIGARGGAMNDTAFAWNSGGIVPNPYPNNSTWRDGFPRYFTNRYCLHMNTYYYDRDGGPIWEYGCTGLIQSICEMICPLGFFHIGHHCYKAFPIKASSWSEAHSMCEEAHLTLAQPEDPIEVANFLFIATGNRNYWIGGRGDGSMFRWTSGEAISSTWAAWESGNPGSNVGKDDCLKLVPDHRNTPLTSAPCSTPLYPLCQ